MKKITILLLITLSLISCKKDKNTEEITTDNKIASQWSDFNLSGKVNSISEYTTETDSKEQTGSRKFESNYKPDISLIFDESGKLIQKNILNENGTLAEEVTYDGKDKILTTKQYVSSSQFALIKYTWDGNNNTIITRKNPDGTQLEKEVFQYDKGLKVNRLKFNMSDAQVDRIAYSYDADNRLIEEKYFRDKPNVQSSLAIEYDNNGNKSAEASYDKDFKLIWKTAFTYNENNFLINSKTYNTEGIIEYELTNTYDNQNRLISKEVFEFFNNSKNKEDLEYDNKNNITSRIIFNNGKAITYLKYTFDEKNNLLSEIRFDESNNVVYSKRIEYTYDVKSNWIKKKTIINDTQTFFTSRKIEYFK